MTRLQRDVKDNPDSFIKGFLVLAKAWFMLTQLVQCIARKSVYSINIPNVNNSNEFSVYQQK